MQRIFRHRGYAYFENLKFVRQFSNGKVLDVGCSTGDVLCKVSKTGIGLDVNKRAIEIARKAHPGYEFKCIDLQKYKGKYDTVLCLHVLEHIEDDIKAIKKLKSFLKPDGRLIVGVPLNPKAFSKHDKAVGHYRRYSQREIIERLNGFKVVALKTYGGFLLRFLTLVMGVNTLRCGKSVSVIGKMMIPLLKLDTLLTPVRYHLKGLYVLTNP